jgi:hypothetical protein
MAPKKKALDAVDLINALPDMCESDDDSQVEMRSVPQQVGDAGASELPATLEKDRVLAI